jgi:hypothetical protein
MPITNQSLKITEKVFWNGTSPRSSKIKNPLIVQTLPSSFTCAYKGKDTISPEKLELYPCFLKIENSYKD